VNTKRVPPNRAQRLRRVLIGNGILLLLAVGYLALVVGTGTGLPCVLYELTGFKCVSCGITRMLLSLMAWELDAAFSYNPFLFVTGPFVLAYLAVSEAVYVKSGSLRLGRLEIAVWVWLALAIAYGVLRNIIPI